MWDMHFNPHLQLPNEWVSFGAASYVGSRNILILPPTSPFPSNHGIDTILWTSARRRCSYFGSREIPYKELNRDMEEKGIVLPEWVPGVQSLTPPCCSSIWTSGTQSQSSFPPILLNHGQDNPRYESLFVVELPELSDAVFDSQYHSRRT